VPKGVGEALEIGERDGRQRFPGCSADPGDIAGVGTLGVGRAAVEPGFDQLGVGTGLRRDGRGREELGNSDFGHFQHFRVFDGP
jgi:hypothetical protein